MTEKKKRLGMHVRIHNSLDEVIVAQQKYNVQNIQCFLLDARGRGLEVSSEQAERFVKFSKKLQTLFLHASYYSNLVNISHKSKLRSFYECYNAELLGFTHVVFHPGSRFRSMYRKQALQNIVEHVQWLLEQTKTITIVLENVAAKGRNIGGSLDELYAVYQMLSFHPRVKFCFDTSHAYAFGYNLLDSQAYMSCMQRLASFGKDAWVLLHINETKKQLGSCIDQHKELQVNCLQEALQSVVREDVFENAVALTELPARLTQQEHDENITLLANWLYEDTK